MAKPKGVLHYPGSGLFTLAFFAYLYLPIVVVVAFSFNANRMVSVWTGFSLKWYGQALQNKNLMTAVWTSLTVALIATVLATTVALMAALVLARPRKVRFARLSETVVNPPLILPGVFAGATLAFVISMDDFITSNMLSPGGTTTLPVYIIGLIRQGTTPELNAISSLIILISLGLAAVALTVSARAGKRDVQD